MSLDPSHPELSKRVRTPQVPAQRCFACGDTNSVQTKRVVASIPFKEESFEVEYDCTECSHCGTQRMSNDQLTARIREVVKAYQKRHGLLTAEQVAARRKATGLHSQQDFVTAVKGVVSLATLKRVEAGQHVQDMGTDYVIRKSLEEVEASQRRSAMNHLCQVNFEGSYRTASFSAQIHSWKTETPSSIRFAFSATHSVCLKKTEPEPCTESCPDQDLAYA